MARRAASSSAQSPCISPSTSNSGMRVRNKPKVARIFSAEAALLDPKLEWESNATLGTRPNADNWSAGEYQSGHRTVHGGSWAVSDHFIDVVQVPRGGGDGSANHSISLAFFQKHGAYQCRAPAHFQSGVLRRDAVALCQRVIRLPVLPKALVLLGIDDDKILAYAQPQTMALQPTLNDRGASHQYRCCQLFIHYNLNGAKYPLIFTLGVHNAAVLRRHLASGDEDRLHQRAAVVDKLQQSLSVGFQVQDGARRHA